MRPLHNLTAREQILLAACVAACIVFAIVSPYFGTIDNANTILRNSVELLLIGLGMTLLMAMGAIDVSIGIVLGVAAIVVGQSLLHGFHPLVVTMSGPIVGAILGIVTAVVVVLGRVPAIVGTLGLLGVYRAVIYFALGGQWLSGLPRDLTTIVTRSVFGIPVTYWVIVLVYFCVWIALRRTPFGLHLLATGGSEEKARLSGLSVIKIKFAAFVVSGALAGLAATFYVATYRNVEMTIGTTLALDAVAAVVLGGTRIQGGRCSLIGTMLGVLLLRILQNGLLLIGVPSLWQPVITGSLLIAVLSLEAIAGRFFNPKLSFGAKT